MPTLAERFPNASADFLRLNSSLPAMPADGIVAKTKPAAPVGPNAPILSKARKSKANTPAHDPDQLTAILTAALERAKADYQASVALVERNLRDGPLAKDECKSGNPRKFLVRVTSFRRRLLDDDNLCEKYHVDLCRYAGLLRSDAPGQARIVPAQEKVRSEDDERTVIEIEPL